MDYLPKFKPGAVVTFTATADVTGGRLVSLSGSRAVATSAADSTAVVGVAAADVVSGEKVAVYTRPTGVHGLVASGAIAIGAKVISAANGKIATAAGSANSIGIALEAAAADNDVIDVLFL